MINDLYEVYERLALSKTDITSLSELVKKSVRENVAFTYVPKEGRPGDSDIYVRQIKKFPIELRSRSGTIINELRSCLDSLACVLAERNNQSAKNVYFPISKSLTIFETDGMRKIKNLSEADKNTIVEISPYMNGNPTLFRLHHADIERKHIRLLGVGTSNSGAHFGGGVSVTSEAELHVYDSHFDDVEIREMHYKSGYIIPTDGTSLLIVDGAPDALRIQFAVSFIFVQPDVISDLELIKTLIEFYNEVERVIRLFDHG
tara:strand:- start:2159 stop:2938 length:780 start_codon:yes stop_codon:yes gene_type:complete